MRKNIITIALSLAMLAAAPLGCGPLPAPDGGSTGALETSTDPGEGESTGGPGGTSQGGTEAATGETSDATGGASWGSTGAETSGPSSGGDMSTGGGTAETSTGETSTGGEGDTLACEGDPCVTHEDCKAGLDLLMCWPIGGGVCMEACDPMDPHACDDAPERCQAWPGTPVFLCQPLIPKAPNNTGKCVPK